MTAGTSPVWPEKFHKRLPFEMARLYQEGLDSDDLSFRMSPSQARIAKLLKEGMELWDDNLKLEIYNQPDPENVNFSGLDIEL